MRLTPRDIEKLMLHTACVVAQKRYARGLKLNYPEAIALISGQLLELIRDGHSLAELTELGAQILGTNDVMPGVAEMIAEVQVEGTLVDGTKLVSVHEPIRHSGLDSKLALYASGLTKSKERIEIDNSMNHIPGQVELIDTPITINEGRKTISMDITNKGSRPIQIGSHCNFAETNKALCFDRMAAVGYRLNIPAGTAVRFEPGETKHIELVEIAGEKKVFGGNNLVNGCYTGREKEIESNMKEKSFID